MISAQLPRARQRARLAGHRLSRVEESAPHDAKRAQDAASVRFSGSGTERFIVRRGSARNSIRGWVLLVGLSQRQSPLHLSGDDNYERASWSRSSVCVCAVQSTTAVWGA